MKIDSGPPRTFWEFAHEHPIIVFLIISVIISNLAYIIRG